MIDMLYWLPFIFFPYYFKLMQIGIIKCFFREINKRDLAPKFS